MHVPPNPHIYDQVYLQIILDCIRVCANYKPRFGKRLSTGLTVHEFQHLYRQDPLYHWFGLDNPRMYAAHKAAGGMTSVYRQIGLGCERLFRRILRDTFQLTKSQATWSYKQRTPEGHTRRLSLDGRILTEDIQDNDARSRFSNWMKASAKLIGVSQRISNTLTGAVFEVRQGYKSKDSKRQNADLANASTAYIKSYLPCIVVLSNQIDDIILNRYRSGHWAIITGTVGKNDPLRSTYDFMREVVGYDLAAFFERNMSTLRSELDVILRSLLMEEL